MKILFVNAYAATSSGNEQFKEFQAFAMEQIKKCSHSDVDHIEADVRQVNELKSYLFELNSEFSDPHAITRFDHLDFVFVNGDLNLPPWTPSLRQACVLVKMCMLTGKCLFGSGFTAGMISYLCSTGGVVLKILNGNGHGTTLDEIKTFVPPTDAHSHGVFLDSESGDLFRYDAKTISWRPSGNTGMIPEDCSKPLYYGVRPGTARPSGRQPTPKFGEEVFTSIRGEVKACVRLEKSQHWSVRNILEKDFVLFCHTKWNLDEKIAGTSENRYTTIIDSHRGPLLIEFGNTLGAYFRISKKYPQSITVMKTYIQEKCHQIRINGHLDRSYAEALAEPQPTLRPPNSSMPNPTRQTSRLSVHSSTPAAMEKITSKGRRTNQEKEKHEGDITVLDFHESTRKASPKKCRSMSAASVHSQRHVTAAKPILSPPSDSASRASAASRNVNRIPSARSGGSSKNSNVSPPAGEKTWKGRTDVAAHLDRLCMNTRGGSRMEDEESCRLEFDASRRDGRNALGEREESKEEMGSFNKANKTNSQDKQKPIRVQHLSMPGKEKPYSTYAKFQKMRASEAKADSGTGFYSIVNDAPYITPYEMDRMDYQRNKLRWTSGGFNAVVGRATTTVEHVASIVNTGPYQDDLTPHNILNRRECPEKNVDLTRRFKL